MADRPPSPIWSILIFTAASAAAVALLRDKVATFRPDATVIASLIAAMALWLIGFVFFGGRFGRPVWKTYAKGIGFLAISYFLLIWLGLWAWPLILLHQGSGMIGYLVICRRHGIDWRTTEPRDRYIALMEKWARGEFR